MNRAFCDSDWHFAVRRVRNKPNFIKENGVSSALFKDSKGVSVNKDHGRTIPVMLLDEERLHRLYCETDEQDESMLKAIVSIDRGICESKGVLVRDVPLKENKHHSILLRSEEKIQLTDSQAKALARSAKIIKKYDSREEK